MCWLSGGEPTLDDMLLDPTIVCLMKRDRVDPDALRQLLRDMSRRLTADNPWILRSSDDASAQPSSPHAWEVQRGTATRGRHPRETKDRLAQVPVSSDGASPER